MEGNCIKKRFWVWAWSRRGIFAEFVFTINKKPKKIYRTFIRLNEVKEKDKKNDCFRATSFSRKVFFCCSKLRWLKNISFFFSSTGSENFNFSSVSVFAPETDSFSFQILPKDSGLFLLPFQLFWATMKERIMGRHSNEVALALPTQLSRVWFSHLTAGKEQLKPKIYFHWEPAVLKASSLGRRITNERKATHGFLLTMPGLRRTNSSYPIVNLNRSFSVYSIENSASFWNLNCIMELYLELKRIRINDQSGGWARTFLWRK